VTMIVRSETHEDFTTIRIVHEVAFGQRAEAQLVDDLRVAGDSVFSLVAVDDGIVAGHVLFSRMTAPFRALALAPVAVLPEYRRMGFASRLIRQGIDRSEADGWRGIFVLGDPAFYRRFGFNAAKASDFASPYAGLYLMVLPLGGSELPASTGVIQHAPAFAKLG
jgi:putative acetyltransferase